MNSDKQRIAIAEFCGWKDVRGVTHRRSPKGGAAVSDDEFVQSGLLAAIKTASNLEKRIAELERENAALNHALNVAQTELRLNGCAKAADEVSKLHDAARKEAQQSVTK